MTTNKMQLFLIYLFLVCSTHFGYCQPWMRWNSVPSHPWNQPAAVLVDNRRSCKYSYVLLMMGEGIARNMYSRLEINKSRIVASCWSSFIRFPFLTCLHVCVGLQVTKCTIRFMNNFSTDRKEPLKFKGRFLSLSPSFTYFLPFHTVICAISSF
jgi:hypothetical protein